MYTDTLKLNFGGNVNRTYLCVCACTYCIWIILKILFLNVRIHMHMYVYLQIYACSSEKEKLATQRKCMRKREVMRTMELKGKGGREWEYIIFILFLIHFKFIHAHNHIHNIQIHTYIHRSILYIVVNMKFFWKLLSHLSTYLFFWVFKIHQKETKKKKKENKKMEQKKTNRKLDKRESMLSCTSFIWDLVCLLAHC